MTVPPDEQDPGAQRVPTLRGAAQDQDEGVAGFEPTDTGGQAGRRARRLGVGVLVGVLLAAVVVSTVPAANVRWLAAATVADALNLPVARPFAPDVARRQHIAGGVDGDLYDPGSAAAPVVLFVPGATPAGRNDRRVVEVAEAVARSGQMVFVPELEVYGEDVVPEDVDRIVRAATALTSEDRGRVVLVGVSFGGALCLLAAADDRLDDRVALVATFGGYLDLIGVLQAATTGAALVEGERLDWDADPRAEEIVRERLTGLMPPAHRRATERALDGQLDPDDLAPPARAAYELLTNDDPARTFALAAELPASVRDRLATVSPSSVVDRLAEVPIVAMHATDDPVIPYGELVRLGAALPHAQLITVGSFEHVDLDVGSPRAWVRAGADLWRVWRFTTAVLGAQAG